jgi:hypothetical protein
VTKRRAPSKRRCARDESDAAPVRAELGPTEAGDAEKTVLMVRPLGGYR